MLQPNDSPPPIEPVLAMARGELTSTRRWAYRLVLVAAGVSVAALLSLWVTEPGPLPLRLHVAFAAMTVVGVGWVSVLSWILTRRRCPTALDRIATAWMATGACLLSLLVSVSIAITRGQPLAALTLGIVGAILLAVALRLLSAGYSLRTRLQAKLVELERSQATSVDLKG